MSYRIGIVMLLCLSSCVLKNEKTTTPPPPEECLAWEEIVIPQELVPRIIVYCGGQQQYDAQLLALQQSLHQLHERHGVSPDAVLWLAWSEHNLKPNESWLNYDSRARQQLLQRYNKGRNKKVRNLDRLSAAQQVVLVDLFFEYKKSGLGIERFACAGLHDLQLFIFAPAKYAQYCKTGDAVLYTSRSTVWQHVARYDRNGNDTVSASEFIANLEYKYNRDREHLQLLAAK